jgi:hypothetical protein
MTECGLIRTVSDEGCYSGKLARIATHVDDFLVTVATNTKLIELEQ